MMACMEPSRARIVPALTALVPPRALAPCEVPVGDVAPAGVADLRLDAVVEARAAVVEAQALYKSYGSGEAAVTALDGVDVCFAAGRFAAVMGASGSGKSTLLHLLAGLDQPSGGRVVLDGVDLTKLDERRLTRLRRDKTGFVFQSFNLLPTLNAEENILLPLSLARRPVDRQWFRHLVEIMGIADRLSHRPCHLSGGQQQRVAVARALMSRPAVVFADEPTGNLDSKASDDVLALLRRAVDDLGQTVVMVTHDARAASYTDDLVIIADGRVVHHGEAGNQEAVRGLVEQAR
jgi:putative ABC transport system ATP-binding protein